LSWHKQVVETGIPASYETSFVTPQGDTYGWFIVSLTKLGDGLISRFIDISQRKADEKKIQEQNLLLESIFHASLNAIITCEAVRDSSGSVVDLKFLHVNDMFKRMVLSDEKDVLGRNMLELFPRTQTSGVFEKHCEVLDTGVPARFEIHYDGERLSAWFEVSSVKLDNNRIVISFANITNAKTAALQIESQKLLLDNILKHSLSGIAVYKAIKDEQGIVQDFQCILANEATENLTGIPNSLRLSTTMCELVPSLRNSPNFEKAVLALQEGQPFQTSMYYEPVQKWMDLSVARMDSDHLINVFVDISTIKRAQVELEHSLVELKRSHESLEEFTRNASHDLKEPIRKVQFFLDRLRQSLGNRLSEEEQKIYSRLENANTRMGTLVDDLLEYSHVNQQSLKSEAVDLNTVLKLVLADLEAMIQDKRGKVIVTELLPVINGDRIQLQQLFFNLVNNSLKYSQSGLPPQVVISSQKLKGAESGFDLTPDSDFKDFYLVQIIDNGIGFEQEHAHHIFNVFTRLHGNSEYSGTGVGLAIVRKVVENHNGFIKAEGTPGKGAMFSILLPT
jgi:signal transduction histidine kinase